MQTKPGQGLWTLLILATGTLLAAPAWLRAADYTWWEQAPNGYWDDPMSWIPYGVPGPDSGAVIQSTYESDLKPVYRSTTAPTLRGLLLDTPTGTGGVHFTQSQDRLVSAQATVGLYGKATYTQDGGEAEFELLRLGRYAPSVGTYRLQGSATLKTTKADIGSSGTGDFTLDGSAFHSADRVWIADGSTYRVKGGKLSTDTLAVESDFIQTGGQTEVYTEFSVNLGLLPPAAKVDLQAGSLKVQQTLTIPFGTFEQNGGTLYCGALENGAPSLCSVLDGTFEAHIVHNSGFFGQSGGLATETTHFENLAGATFMQSGGLWTGSKFVNQSNQMTLMGTAELRIRTFDNLGTFKMTAGTLRGPKAMPGLYYLCDATNDGTFRMEGGAFRGGRLTSNGTFEYVAGDFTESQLILNGAFARDGAFACRQLTNNTTLNASSAKPLNVSGDNYVSAIENTGTLTVSGNAIVVTSAAPLNNKGELGGSGTLQANVKNESNLTVGTPSLAVNLAVTGDFAQTGTGTLRMNIAQLVPGTPIFDRLQVSGHASLAGALALSNAGYALKADQYTLLTFAAQSGGFTDWDLPALTSGLVWARVTTPTSLALLVRTPMKADFDADGDLDRQDMATFLTCVPGPISRTLRQQNCDNADFDDDGDVDQVDFGAFQRCYSGTGIPAENGCAN